MDFLKPFVLPVQEVTPERHDSVDLYLPESTDPVPAIVFVHGGPVRADQRPTPREWPVFRGYAALACASGLAAVTVDHRLHDPAAHAVAAGDVSAAVDLVRRDPRVDADRIALWFFSGGGLLLADWLRTPPPYLRAAAATYPLLAPFPGWPVDPRFLPSEAVSAAGTLPIVLTRVGQEHSYIAETVANFVDAARNADLTIVDVPDGHHGFDYLDDTDESRQAIERAMSLVRNALVS
jgi:dienelactone hydrolase